MNAITGAVHPTSTWHTDRWTQVVAHHGRLLREAVSQAEPDLPVATTPGWTFRDLALHVGRFAEQVTHYLSTRSIVMLAPPPMPDDDPVAYLDHQLTALDQALAATPANVPVWTLSPTAPDLAWVWHRRAAHELNLRRWEAQAALRTLEPTDRNLAVDGIDETLTTLLPAKYGTEIPVTVTGSVLVSATDGPESWQVALTPGEIPAVRAAVATDHADAHLTSTAADLHYHLRNRTDVDGDGSPALLRAIIVE